MFTRAADIVQELKSVPVESQMRRHIKKRSFSGKKIAWMDWLAFDLFQNMNVEEKGDISVINTVMFAIAAVMAFNEGEEFSVSGPKKVNEKGEPKWKRRLDCRLVTLRKEVDILKAHLDHKIVRKSAFYYLECVMKKYGLDGYRGDVEPTLFRLKNQISAVAAKIRRYQVQLKSKQQNELFYKDRKKFFRSIFEESQVIAEPPNEDEVRTFWAEKIWGDAEKYSGNADWLEGVRKNYKGVKEQAWTDVTEEEVSEQLCKSMNWKAPGVDGLSNFWLKSIPCAHKLIAKSMNKYIKWPGGMPDWVIKGRATLLPKSKQTVDPTQYRPIACLTTYWKCLSGILSERITFHLNQNDILAVEQQGAIKNSYGTKTQLLINKSVFEDAMRKKKDLSMLYIDYQKAYDSVPHNWIVEMLNIYKVSPVIINFLVASMERWTVDMFIHHEKGTISVENVRIQRGIFQGDSLSPLLFIIALNPLSLLLNRRCQGYKLNSIFVTHILYLDDLKAFSDSYANLKVIANVIEQFTSDIGMELGLKKCKVINLVKGKHTKLGGIQLSSGGIMEELEGHEVYKYLGVEELEGMSHEEMKVKVWKSAKVKLRKILETELNSRNIIQAINESVLPVVSYSFGIVNWLEADIKGIDINIRKMLNMYKMLELKSDTDRLYLSRKKGGRGLISVWDAFRGSTVRIAHALLNTDNVILLECQNIDRKGRFSNINRAVKYEEEVPLELPKGFNEKPVLLQARVKASCMRKALYEKRLDAWRDKPQHGAFLRQLELGDADVKESFSWLSKCYLDPATESYVCAAQELAVFTKFHEKHILKNSDDDRCRVCKKEQETVFHILSGCDTLAKREYFTRHNNMCKYVHYKIMKAYAVECAENWYAHVPKDVILMKRCEIIYDQVIYTDRPVACNRPDIIVKDLVREKVFIIDVSCPCDTNVRKKELEKITKYRELKGELQKMWGMECEVIPLIVGGLGAVTKNLRDYLACVPGLPEQYMCQKIVLMGSKRILRDVLGRRVK